MCKENCTENCECFGQCLDCESCSYKKDLPKGSINPVDEIFGEELSSLIGIAPLSAPTVYKLKVVYLPKD